PHFKTCVRDAGAWSVMCAYNRFRGEPCCGSNPLLQKILRREWGFRGYVVSDCWAIKDFWAHHRVVDTPEKAAAKAVRAGTDLNCGDQYPALVEAVKTGLISESEIDVSVSRLFEARFRLGMFDPPERVSYAAIPYTVVDSPEHDRLAFESACKSLVLLKNSDNLLPLDKNLKSLAVIGPNADNLDVLLGNYNGTPSHPVTVLQGIRRAVSADTEVHYAQGCELADGLLALSPIPADLLGTADDRPGLDAEYYAHPEFTEKAAVQRIDAGVDFYWADRPPVEGLTGEAYAVRWSGFLTPARSGSYDLGFSAMHRCSIYLDDELLVQEDFPDHVITRVRTCELTAGRRYRLRVDYSKQRGEGWVQLVWAQQGRDLQSEALAVARDADAIILCLGLSPRLEGEEMPVAVKGFSGGDRLTLDLPETQQNLLQAIHQLGRPTVLVLMNGSALSIEWADRHIPAILEAWYPGQRGGDAVAAVLFGDCNPAGRLPVTFYRSVEQLPPFNDYAMAGRTYRFFTGSPLYPFGYGLSYTRFDYSNPALSSRTISAGQSLKISAVVKNTGDWDGEEVVQLYITDLEASVPVPIRSLIGFQRIALKAGESRRIDFAVQPRHMAVVDDDGEERIKAGAFELSLGGRQPATDEHAMAATLSLRFTVSNTAPLED
ncbi:glycoside hydrolase family 3 C-terminal domain-containing protein, partial [candidate division KSB1 bacterium]|nr:glycoside hydrolase family 3 C-terminal domain-containing protein [candidate division KSB1 bacterium]